MLAFEASTVARRVYRRLKRLGLNVRTAHPIEVRRRAGRCVRQGHRPRSPEAVRETRVPSGRSVPTIQRIYGCVSMHQTLHYVVVGQDEMTEGFVAFDAHIRVGMESVTPPPQRQTVS